MAKSRRSRRTRRTENETQNQTVDSPVASTPTAVSGNGSQPVVSRTSSPSFGKTVDYATEYFYVYSEVRNILIIAVVMFVILLGLSYFI